MTTNLRFNWCEAPAEVLWLTGEIFTKSNISPQNMQKFKYLEATTK
jgi:hypothetical protein